MFRASLVIDKLDLGLLFIWIQYILNYIFGGETRKNDQQNL